MCFTLGARSSFYSGTSHSALYVQLGTLLTTMDYTQNSFKKLERYFIIFYVGGVGEINFYYYIGLINE